MSKELEQAVGWNITDAVMDLVETIQMSWKSTPNSMQIEFEKKLREAITTNVTQALQSLAARDFPMLIADLEAVRIKKGKVVVTLSVPQGPGADSALSLLSGKAKQGAEVLVIMADPKDYVDAEGTSRAEDDQQSIPGI